jgi:hypothetical protein
VDVTNGEQPMTKQRACKRAKAAGISAQSLPSGKGQWFLSGVP